jgi:hypothetical protein
VRCGAEVTVITCAPNFPSGRVFEGYRNRLYQKEVVDGVTVIRVWSYMTPNTGVAKRILDYLSFSICGTMAGLGQRFDILIATSPQFFTAVAGWIVGTLRRRPWVFELRDLWPESIVATGAMRRSRTIDALERLEMTLYRSADLIVSVTKSFEHHLVKRGISRSKIRVVTNGVVAEEFDCGAGCSVWTPDGGRPFRVGYVGTHGLAHGLDVVLRTAAAFDPSEVSFVLVGDGADKARLIEEAAWRSLPNVAFRDPVPRHRVPQTLAEFDACLVPLRDTDTFRSVIPSKIFEAAAARRPILLGLRGESEEIVRTYNAGLPFEPESDSGLAREIRRMMAEPGLYASLQEGGARMARAYDRRALARRMLQHLQDVAGVESDHDVATREMS